MANGKILQQMKDILDQDDKDITQKNLLKLSIAGQIETFEILEDAHKMRDEHASRLSEIEQGMSKISDIADDVRKAQEDIQDLKKTIEPMLQSWVIKTWIYAGQHPKATLIFFGILFLAAYLVFISDYRDTVIKAVFGIDLAPLENHLAPPPTPTHTH